MTWVGHLTDFGSLFVVSAITPNLNFVMPVRPIWLIVIFSQSYHWVLVAFIATLGATVGVIPLYKIIYNVQKGKSVQGWLRRRWVRRIMGMLKGRDFLAILVIVLTPLPDQLIGIVSGVNRYPMGKFLLANFLGRFAFYLIIAYLGAVGAARFGTIGSWFLPFLQI